jgi:hypothetical protein
MEPMRRSVVFAAAAAYGFSLVAACLAACLLPAAPASHACCATEDGIRPAATDCCSVTPAVAHATPAATVASRPAGPAVTLADVPTAARVILPVAASASPPLVLRV